MTQTTNDWRDYVEIGPDFPPEDRAHIEQALSDIWSAADSEGRKLIIAAQKRGEGKILISFKDDEDVTSYAVRDDSTHLSEIVINPEMLDTVVVKENGAERYMSLTSALVHELYHLADPHNKGGQGLVDLAEKIMRGQGGSDERVSELTSEFNKLVPALGLQGTVDMMMDAEPSTTREKTIELLRQNGLEQTAALFESTPPETFRALLLQGKFIDREGMVLSEKDAVRFTDAFMLKNFGSLEPQRGDYTNSGQVSTPNPNPVPRLPAVVFTGPGFESELGGLAPIVQPSRSEDYPVRTATPF